MSFDWKFERNASTWRDFVSGTCHVCHQRNMRVRKLWCERHNYCRSCAEFLPRLRNGDFSCQRCPENGRVDPYLVSQNEYFNSRNNRSQHLVDSDESDDNDLEGNNQNLDELLETLIEPSIKENIASAQENQEEFKPIPRKLSFLHVSLPSAHNDVNEETTSAKPNFICNTVTQLLHSPEKLLSRRAELQRKCATNRIGNKQNVDRQKEVQAKDTPTKTTETTQVFSNFKPESPELERNTSPCKALRPRSCQSDFSDNSFQATSSQSETEQLLDLIGKIDGPGPSSSSSRSGSVTSNISYDDFWDMKVA